MDTLREIWSWTMANYQGVLISASMILLGLEGIVRLTPTKKDDTALERAGKGLRWLMDLLKVPNVKREKGKVMPAGLHKPRK